MSERDYAAESAEATDDDAETATAAGTATVAETPPHCSGLPVVGSTVAASRDGVAFTDRVASHGDLVSYSAFGTEMLAVFDPEVVDTVLVSESDAFEKGEFEMAFGDLVAPEGLAFAEGERWRRQRTALQSAFTPDKIRSYADAMVEHTAALSDDWADGEVVEVGDAFASLTLRILTRALFDLDFDAERGAVVREATDSISAIMDRFGLLSVLPEWVPTPTKRRYERAMADLDALVESLMAERSVARSATDGASGDEPRASTDEERDDLLSLLVAAADAEGTGMDRDAVRDQLVTFLFAGHETTATALTYVCWLLAGNPNVRERLDAELDSVLGDRDPTFADVPNLDYTEQVVEEALRLYPPVYALYREAREPTVLGGYRVPADATLQLATYSIQRDERWWDAPDEFRPERWDSEAGDVSNDGRPEYAYFPFGGGPRHCIGMRFAMTELQLVLATLARRVEFERVTEKLDLSMGLTLDPGAVELRVRKRE
ncbi:cytochrome P450 [Halorussus gelatinilyticus]|uniref:Cytochrome P450 n=1 Tax=Halorussus gelatinilyticus TaxID=2937524 RepID=A0A8U0IK40_9EURY|nr:cytochrome P450 [Halorussus gelatinilyticus]UPW00672.1 cytochrome P450 [Halorussus gelatinilyticus]